MNAETVGTVYVQLIYIFHGVKCICVNALCNCNIRLLVDFNY